MRSAVIVVGLLASPALLADAPEEWITHSFSGQLKLEVLVRSADGQEIPGATVSLCPVGRSKEPGASRPMVDTTGCSVTVADANGEARFEGLERTDYRAAVDLDGFVPTVVYPLSIGERERGAPDQILVVLNAWCCEY